MLHNTQIKPFSIAPLEKESDLDSYDRLPELVKSVSNEVCSSQGGCFLVTGYRGVGKTSFVNKVLQTTKTKLTDKTIVVPVRLSLARGYSTDKLLRRLIRELFYAINRNGVYDKLDIDSRQKLNTAFLRTSRQIKTALAQGLKEAVSKTDTNATRYSSETKFDAGIGIEKIASLLGSFSAKREKEHSVSKTHSKETSSELGMEIEFLEYDDEIAENDLSELIDLFQDKQVEIGQKSTEASSRKLRQPEWFWKTLNKLFPRIETFTSVTKPESTPIHQSIKLLFVLDEIDKMSVDDAEQIFRSLKNLFLKGNVFFFLVTGKAFYYDWLRKRTSEDDIFFSLFTRIIHISLFSDEEFDAIVNKLAVEFPDDLLAHLKYKAKGTPREFLREVSRFVDWSTETPTISVKQSSERLLQISARLYPYIQKQYEATEQDERIDIGIRDHLRRSLHNWLEWMMILVTFTKSAVMRPTTEGEKESDQALFSARTRDTFDKLFNSLLEDDIIKDTNLTTNDEHIYTFTGQIRESLEEIDSSISSQVPSAKVEQQRKYNELVMKFSLLLENDDYIAASNLLSEIQELEDPESKDSSRLEMKLKARELVKNGDQLFAEGLFESAFGAYRKASAKLPDSTEIKSKLMKAQFAMAFEQAEKAKEYDDYKMAENALRAAIENSHEFFETDIAQMKKDAKGMVDQFVRILYLQDSLARNLKAGELRDVQQDFQELIDLAPKMRSLGRIDEQVAELTKDTLILDQARKAISEQNYDEAEKLLRQILGSKNIRIAQQAEELLQRNLSIKNK